MSSGRQGERPAGGRDDGRLLLVSNRLAVTITTDGPQPAVTPSAGGLATAVGPMHEAGTGRWIGWPGELPTDSGTRRSISSQLRKLRLVPVTLDDALLEGYYRGFANSVLWPLFHYFSHLVRIDEGSWKSYLSANKRFAKKVLKEYEPGDTIWVHDYHLMLLPELIRSQAPEARIGFFLHTPFPTSELFRILPWRRELLRGMLGADLIGFHVYDYVRHFRSTVRHVLGAEGDGDQLAWDGRVVRLGAFPISIDPDKYFRGATEDPEALEEYRQIEEQMGGRRLILGVDRMDYTKGIPDRLRGYERFLERYPSHHEKVEFLQIGVPSRTGVDSYQDLKREVDEIVGRVNGRFGGHDWVPVKYMYQSVPFPRLCALYRFAHVGLVTPLRDGMNLVAKEYVACQQGRDGVLVLSEFAGAAAELTDALMVNPYDPDSIAEALHDALSMPANRRRKRIANLGERIWTWSIGEWGERFVEALAATGGEAAQLYPPLLDATARHAMIEQWEGADRRLLLLDYDGSLRPFTNRPGHARPDRKLLELLERLAAAEENQVAVVSGRDRTTLEEWLGGLEVTLVGEHGRWLRRAGDRWRDVLDGEDPTWLGEVREVMDEYARSIPGSLVESKSGSVAWHYRAASPEQAQFKAGQLREQLLNMPLETPLEVLEGSKVIEARAYGVTKAGALSTLLAESPPVQFVLAVGDDVTDEEMFDKLPPSAWSLHIGSRASQARYSVPTADALRSLLQELAEAAG